MNEQHVNIGEIIANIMKMGAEEFKIDESNDYILTKTDKEKLFSYYQQYISHQINHGKMTNVFLDDGAMSYLVMIYTKMNIGSIAFVISNHIINKNMKYNIKDTQNEVTTGIKKVYPDFELRTI